MSAKAAPKTPSSPSRRPKRKPSVAAFAGGIGVAAGLGLLLAGASAGDVATLSDALGGAPVETETLPALG